MSNPKISIVVPIWGVEKYLRQCVDSILAQTFKNIEVILVDDGSPDGCPDIVDEYAARDSRVVAVHQLNGGYGRAVNHGIELAKGEYLGIIESDDWIEPNMYEVLLAKILETDADFVKCGFYEYDSTKPSGKQDIYYQYVNRDLTLAPKSVFSIDEYPQLMMFHASIWAALYKTEFIRGQQVNESRSASYQDFPFYMELLCRAKKIAVIATPLVHYRREEGQSSSTQRADARLLNMPKQCMNGKEILKRYKKIESHKEVFFEHCYCTCTYMFRMIQYKYKYRYFKLLNELFCDIGEDFKGEYLTKQEIQCIRSIQENSFIKAYLSLMNINTFRHLIRFLLNIHIRRSVLFIQILGLQFCKGRYKELPAFKKWHIR